MPVPDSLVDLRRTLEDAEVRLTDANLKKLNGAGLSGEQTLRLEVEIDVAHMNVEKARAAYQHALYIHSVR